MKTDLLSVIAVVFVFGIFLAIAALVGIWYLKPKRISDADLEILQIEKGIPSLYKTLQGIRIHYHQLGEGPDVVLLHGMGASTFIWRKLIPLLAKDFRVTAIDMPGFGRSQKTSDFKLNLDSMSDFIAKFLTELGIEQFSLVGSSMGGGIALWIAKKFRKRCSNVVTIAPATNKSLVRYRPFVLKLFTPLHYLINKKTMLVAVENVIRQRDLITDDVIDGYLLPFRDRGEAWKSFLSATEIISDPRMPNELAELETRTEFRHLNIWGDDDRVVPKYIQDELQKVLPRSEFVILPHLGHHPFEEDPQKIARLIRDFLSRPQSTQTQTSL